MTRRVRQFVVFQAAAGGTLGIIAICSFFFTPRLVVRANDTNWLALLAFEGRARIFWFQSSMDPFEVLLEEDSQVLEIKSLSRGSAIAESLVGPPESANFRRLIPIGARRQLPAFGGAWRSPLLRNFQLAPLLDDAPWRPQVTSSFVRFPLGVVVVVLLYAPFRVIYKDRQFTKRLKSNQCTGCGYSLVGLTTLRCPECGRDFSKVRTTFINEHTPDFTR